MAAKHDNRSRTHVFPDVVVPGDRRPDSPGSSGQPPPPLPAPAPSEPSPEPAPKPPSSSSIDFDPVYVNVTRRSSGQSDTSAHPLALSGRDESSLGKPNAPNDRAAAARPSTETNKQPGDEGFGPLLEQRALQEDAWANYELPESVSGGWGVHAFQPQRHMPWPYLGYPQFDIPPSRSAPARKGGSRKRPPRKIISKKFTPPQEERALDNPADEPSKPDLGEIVQKVINRTLDNPDFEEQLKGNLFESGLTHLPLGRKTGGFRNFLFALINTYTGLYDPTDDENGPDKLVCTGIHETIYWFLLMDEELSGELRPELAYRETSGGPFGDFPHHALQIEVDGQLYAIDWWMKLEYDNPVIFKLEDWQAGRDDMGIEFKDLKDGAG